jgi:ABC-2 type transport system permease protein
VFAFIFGAVSSSVSSAGISRTIDRQFAKLGTGSIATPTGYLALIFLVVILVVSLFACAQVGTARRLLIAAGATVVISLLSGLLTWAGAAAGGASVSLGQMLEAGANCLPVAMLFLGIAALAYAVVPRASAAIAYSILTVSFLWQAAGALLGAPGWLVGLTPFAHVGLVPVEPFRVGAAAIMAVIGLAAALAALAAFRRRDLLGA